MIERLKNLKMIRGTSVQGVSVHLQQSGEALCSALLLKRVKNNIVAENTAEGKPLSEIIPSLSKSQPLCLTIDGRGIIHKKVQATPDTRLPDLLQQVLPNATLADFYVQKTRVDDTQVIVSLCRKDVLSDILREFETVRLFVVRLYLGPFAVKNILSLMDDPPAEILVPGYLLFHQNGVLTSFERTDREVRNLVPYKVSDEGVLPGSLCLYASCLAFFMAIRDESRDEKIRQSEDEFYYKRMLQVIGTGLVGFLFAALLVNFLVFDNYRKKEQELSSQVSLNNDLLSQLDTLRGELAQKQQFVEKNCLSGGSRLSFYADRIAFTVPEQILLSETDIFPLQKKLKEEQEALFLHRAIHVSGTTSNSNYLNEWIKILNQEQWAEEVNILNYFQENASTSGVFTIEIRIR